MEISFDDTKVAFAYKTTKELKKARILFATMGVSWLVKLGTQLTPKILKLGLPIKGLIRSTIFSQFVGGESLEATKEVATILDKYQVQVILDYGVEGKQGEKNFDNSKDEFIKVIQYAAHEPNIPFMSIKLTAFARFELLQKMHLQLKSGVDTNLHLTEQMFTIEERKEWANVECRLDEICSMAKKCKVSVLIDAEESWIQNPVDVLCLKMMEKYNDENAVVYNTIQLYRQDRLLFLKDIYKLAMEKKFSLGIKLVRGAYMEKERKRSTLMSYPSPIQPDKESTDRDFNEALEFCVENLDRLWVIVASHNEYSNLYATRLLAAKKYSFSHPHIHFSQLFGMSDNITFNLAYAGCGVSKYLPFGPLSDVIPYLMRRAQENSSVSGQTGRELRLIKRELIRRKRMVDND